MLVLVPNNVYKEQDPFLMIPIPNNIENSDSYQDFSLEDFQWWAYTSDFDAWFKQSGRQWKADESIDFYAMLESLLDEYNGVNESDSSEVLSFSQFLESKVNSYKWSLVSEEEDPTQEVQDQKPYENVSKEDVIKFLFGYQKLLESGSIKTTYDFKNLSKGDEKCIFLGLPKNNDIPELESVGVSGIRFKVRSEVGAGKLMDYDLSYPGPVDISNEEPLESAGRKFATVTSSEILGTIFAGSAVYIAATAVGGWWALQKVNYAVKWGSAAVSAKKGGTTIAGAMKAINAAEGAKKGGGIWKGITKGAKAFYEGFLKFPYKFVKSGSEGVKSAKALNKLMKTAQAGSEASKVVKEVSLVKTFFKFGSKGTIKGAADMIPVVGWVLMGVDAVGSLINWFSDNQAPRPGEAEELFKGKLSFNPSQIKEGETITLCWAQPETSAWGTVLSFLVSNIGETRTILNMTKVLNSADNHSIFMLQSANSESLNKQIQSSLMILIAVPNDKTLEQGIIDNDDFDGKICAVPKPEEGFISPWAFRGICEWSEIEEAVNNAGSSFFKVDPNSPKKYSWNFEDVDGNVINVTGSLVTDEDLSKFTPEELTDIFHGSISTGNVDIQAKKPEEKEEEVEVEEEVLENYKIVGFDRFLTESEKLEEEENKEGAEGKGDAKLPYTKPVLITIYNCAGEANKRYSNPELRGKNKPPKFTNFVINPDDYNAGAGDRIEVIVNSDEDIENPKAGVARYQEEVQKPEDSKTDGKEEGAEEVEDKVQASDKLDASDMVKKERKRSTVIRDKEPDTGTNIMDEFLTDRDREELGIEGWKKITFVKEIRDRDGNVTEVKLKNSDAKFTDKSRDYKKGDAGFEIAKKIAKRSVEDLDFSK